ncbi:MAG: C25 family cysteine peptidase [Candidatus Hydrothermales bacterium]
MYLLLIIIFKTGIFLLDDEVKSKVKIFREGYFGPYKIAVGELRGRLDLNRNDYKINDFHGKILKKIALNPSYIERAKTLNFQCFLESDTPISIPKEVILIYTKKEGLYSIKGYMLTSKGIRIDTINVDYITILGREGKIPIITKGLKDGKFDPFDEIIFYARKLKGKESYFDLYSFENTYILYFNKNLKIELPEENTTPDENLYTIRKGYFNFHFEEDIYFPDLDPAHSDTENIWFWKYLRENKVETLKIQLPLASDSNYYKLRLNFDTEEMSGQEPIHKIELKIGKHFIDSFVYNTRVPYTVEEDIIGYILNSDSLIFLKEKSSVPNYLNYIEIEGEFLLNARGLKNLKFNLDRVDGNIEIKGFTKKPLYFININQKNYTNFEIKTYTESGKTYYSIKARIKENFSGEYYITTEIFNPESIVLYRMDKDIKKESGSNIVIIYHPDFKEFAESLAIYRSSPKGGSFNVKTFSIKDIYVQFNYGTKSPHAIRKFLKYYFIKKEPKFTYLILVGDASKDPRNILKSNIVDKIPTFLFPSTFQQFETQAIFTGFFSSDFYYSNIIGNDPFPDIVVSRIPLQSKNEAKIYYKKIKEYTEENYGIWRRHFILGTERKKGTFSDLYTQLNNFLKSLMKKGTTYVEPDENETPENLISYLSDGCAIFNFIGHGGIHSIWGKAAFRQEDLWETRNYKKYYFFTALSCWTGEFGMIDSRGFGEEALLIPDRGAIATISLSGSGKAPGNVNFDISSDYTKSIFLGYLRDSINRIGDLVLYSRMYILSRYTILDEFVETTLKTSNLLGDPLILLPELEEVELKSNKNYFTPAESVKVFVQNPQVISGISVWEVIYQNLNDEIIHKDLFTSFFENANINISFKIPNNIIRAKTTVNLYAFDFDLKREIISNHKFSVNLLNVDKIYFKPDIYSDDTFRVYSVLSAPFSLKSCELWYTYNDTTVPNNLTRVSMIKTGPNSFKTILALPPFNYESNKRYFHYAFVAIDTFFNSYFSDTFYIENKIYADLFFNKNLVYVTAGRKFPEINLSYTNAGVRDADSFFIFYEIKTKGGKVLKSETLFVNLLKSQETKILKISVPCTSYYYFYLNLDIKDNIKEQNELNNEDFGIILNPYIYVDTSRYKAEYNFNNMIFFSQFYPTDSLSIYELKRGVDKIINDSTLEISLLNYRKLNDTIGKFIFKNIKEKKDVMLRTKRDSLWHKLESTYDSINKKIEFYLQEIGEIALFNLTDKKGPEIEVYVRERKIEEDKFTVSKYLNLKIILKDTSGIDLIFKKPEIIFNGKSLNYENTLIRGEKKTIINLKEGPLKEGTYPLKIIAFNNMGIKSEKSFSVEVHTPFDLIYYGNYPNPTRNERTVIFYELTKDSEIMEVSIFTISGKRIKKFVTDDEGKPLNLKGKHKITWNLRDGYGNKVSKGIYFLLLKAKKGEDQKKVIGKIAVE